MGRVEERGKVGEAEGIGKVRDEAGGNGKGRRKGKGG